MRTALLSVFLTCRSYVATAGMSFLFNVLSAALGLIIFAAYKYCDPIKDGVISKKDQVKLTIIINKSLINHSYSVCP